MLNYNQIEQKEDLQMKKLIAVMLMCVLCFGCSAQKPQEESKLLVDDSILLIGKIVEGLEKTVAYETSDYDSTWYASKHMGNETELFKKCASISSRFEECKLTENRDDIPALLDDMSSVLEMLK